MAVSTNRPRLLVPGLKPPDPFLETYFVRPGGATVLMLRPDDRVTVTDRGRPIAVISAPDESDEVARAMTMVREGLAHWGGGTPRGSRRPVKVRGKTVSRTVLDDRR